MDRRTIMHDITNKLGESILNLTIGVLDFLPCNKRNFNHTLYMN